MEAYRRCRGLGKYVHAEDGVLKFDCNLYKWTFDGMCTMRYSELMRGKLF